MFHFFIIIIILKTLFQVFFHLRALYQSLMQLNQFGQNYQCLRFLKLLCYNSLLIIDINLNLLIMKLSHPIIEN